MKETTTAATKPGDETMIGREIRTLMRKNKMTIRDLSAKMGITMKRIRQVRSAGLACPFAVRDWTEAITGADPGPTAAWLAKRRMA